MSANLYITILNLLDLWIKFLEDPACYQREWISYLQEKRESIANDPKSVRTLVDGNIWGGMGSFLDSAMLDIFFYRPNLLDQAKRIDQWQKAHKICDDWQRKFNIITIELGNCLIQWCIEYSELNENERNMIEKWVQIAKAYNQRPFQPLKKIEIDTLEWNLKFNENHLTS